MLAPWKKSYDQPRQHIKKQRHYFVDKFHLVKSIILPVVMYGYESWTIKKAEHGRINAFELWCWRRLLRVPWTTRRSNQSILKEISPGCSSEGLMLKLKLQNIELASPTQWTWVWASSGSWWWTGRPGMLQSMGSQRAGHDWVSELKRTDHNLQWNIIWKTT